jgi:hypothetical protein
MRKPVVADYGSPSSGSHCYEQALKTWLMHSGRVNHISREQLNAAVRAETAPKAVAKPVVSKPEL